MYKQQANHKVDYQHLSWRDDTVDASFVRDLCQKYNLDCLSQELVNWGVNLYIDCYSLIQKKSSSLNNPTKVFHGDMLIEQNYAQKLNEYYFGFKNTNFSNEEISKFQKNVEALSNRFAGKKIAFWGAGLFAKDLIADIDFSALKPICFFDSDKNKTTFALGGYDIRHVNEVNSVKPDVIITMLKYPKPLLEGIKSEVDKYNLDIEWVDIQNIDEVLF